MAYFACHRVSKRRQNYPMALMVRNMSDGEMGSLEIDGGKAMPHPAWLLPWQ